MRFDFEFDPRFAGFLGGLGVRPDTCWVEVNEFALGVRFGPWRLATPRANVVSAVEAGPYDWWKVIGPHVSLSDRGLTLGTNSNRGVCVELRVGVRGIERCGLLRHRGVTVTVADPGGLARALRGSGRTDGAPGS